jgi:hypothetical protein
LSDLVNDDHMLALYAGHQAGFAQKPLAVQLFPSDLRPDDLQRDRAIKLRVLGAKNDPHAALPEDPEHAVVVQSAEFIGLDGRGEERKRRRGSLDRSLYLSVQIHRVEFIHARLFASNRRLRPRKGADAGSAF